MIIVDSSLLKIFGMEFRSKQMEERLEIAENAGVRFLIVRNKYKHRSSTKQQHHGFQGVEVVMTETHMGVEHKKQFDINSEGKPTPHAYPLDIYPQGQYKIMRGSVPDTPYNRNILASHLHHGWCQLDQLTRNYDDIMKDITKIADNKYPKGTPKTLDSRIRSLVDENKRLLNELKANQKDLELSRNATSFALGAEKAEQYMEQATTQVHTENKHIIDTILKKRKKSELHIDPVYKNSILPLIQARYDQLIPQKEVKI